MKNKFSSTIIFSLIVANYASAVVVTTSVPSDGSHAGGSSSQSAEGSRAAISEMQGPLMDGAQKSIGQCGSPGFKTGSANLGDLTSAIKRPLYDTLVAYIEKYKDDPSKAEAPLAEEKYKEFFAMKLGFKSYSDASKATEVTPFIDAVSKMYAEGFKIAKDFLGSGDNAKALLSNLTSSSQSKSKLSLLGLLNGIDGGPSDNPLKAKAIQDAEAGLYNWLNKTCKETKDDSGGPVAYTPASSEQIQQAASGTTAAESATPANQALNAQLAKDKALAKEVQAATEAGNLTEDQKSKLNEHIQSRDKAILDAQGSVERIDAANKAYIEAIKGMGLKGDLERSLLNNASASQDATGLLGKKKKNGEIAKKGELDSARESFDRDLAGVKTTEDAKKLAEKLAGHKTKLESTKSQLQAEVDSLSAKTNRTRDEEAKLTALKAQLGEVEKQLDPKNPEGYAKFEKEAQKSITARRTVLDASPEDPFRGSPAEQSESFRSAEQKLQKFKDREIARADLAEAYKNLDQTKLAADSNGDGTVLDQELEEFLKSQKPELAGKQEAIKRAQQEVDRYRGMAADKEKTIADLGLDDEVASRYESDARELIEDEKNHESEVKGREDKVKETEAKVAEGRAKLAEMSKHLKKLERDNPFGSPEITELKSKIRDQRLSNRNLDGVIAREQALAAGPTARQVAVATEMNKTQPQKLKALKGSAFGYYMVSRAEFSSLSIGDLQNLKRFWSRARDKVQGIETPAAIMKMDENLKLLEEELVRKQIRLQQSLDP